MYIYLSVADSCSAGLKEHSIWKIDLHVQYYELKASKQNIDIVIGLCHYALWATHLQSNATMA